MVLFGKKKRLIKRVLIVEDEPLVAFDNEQRLERLGYEVVGTRDNYDDAIADLEQSEVDLVLCDVKLASEKSGIDVAAAAHEAGVPVLFATGNPPKQCAAYALGSLVKPYSDRQLRDAIDTVDRLLAGESPKAPTGLTLYSDA
ncbi:response regulator [Sphingomicrobium lutaoense]|uniref:DNA-binding response OmpR family regulator n=1 Tax=Sphingomicrobium lutaoense TaxID=515949 RepID=A0A839Z0S9_9SPHN|nr:response regulator [Sphingomicrobium lutaoense]MBB3764158.1 DNA-binding response OmpR family regulator [Sphingomicrobium lutaoense]